MTTGLFSDTGLTLAARKSEVNAALVKANTLGIAAAQSSGGMLAIGASVLAASSVARSARTGLVVAAVVWALAMLAALGSLWPWLGGDHGFVAWARMAPIQLLADSDQQAPSEIQDARAVVHLSRLAMVKFRLVQASYGLLGSSLLPLGCGWLF